MVPQVTLPPSKPSPVNTLMGTVLDHFGNMLAIRSLEVSAANYSSGAALHDATSLSHSMLGSNLFNMGFVLFLDDLAYSNAALWQGISQVHLITGKAAIFMTGIVIMALLSRPRRRLSRFWTTEGVILLTLYIVASVLVFKLA